MSIYICYSLEPTKVQKMVRGPIGDPQKHSEDQDQPNYFPEYFFTDHFLINANFQTKK